MLPTPPPTAAARSCNAVATAGRCGLAACLLLAMTACASLPAPTQREPTKAIAANAQTELGALTLHAVQQAAITTTATAATEAARSGLRPMPEASVALDARLTLISG